VGKGQVGGEIIPLPQIPGSATVQYSKTSCSRGQYIIFKHNINSQSFIKCNTVNDDKVLYSKYNSTNLNDTANSIKRSALVNLGHTLHNQKITECELHIKLNFELLLVLSVCLCEVV